MTEDSGTCGYEGGYRYLWLWRIKVSVAMVDTSTRSNDGSCTYVPVVTVQGTGTCRLWATVYVGICSYDGGYRYLWLCYRIQIPVAMVEDTGIRGYGGRYR
jgi:hypothetical protein